MLPSVALSSTSIPDASESAGSLSHRTVFLPAFRVSLLGKRNPKGCALHLVLTFAPTPPGCFRRSGDSPTAFVEISFVCIILSAFANKMIQCSAVSPLRMKPASLGFHPVIFVHRTVFAPVCALVPAFRVPLSRKREDTLRYPLFFWGG